MAENNTNKRFNPTVPIILIAAFGSGAAIAAFYPALRERTTISDTASCTSDTILGITDETRKIQDAYLTNLRNAMNAHSITLLRIAGNDFLLGEQSEADKASQLGCNEAADLLRNELPVWRSDIRQIDNKFQSMMRPNSNPTTEPYQNQPQVNQSSLM